MSLFSGIGAFEKALSNIGLEYDLVGYSEIDKYPSAAYSAIHNVSEDKNLGDIKEINAEELEDFNLMTYGFPCRDISIAGEKEGFSKEKETRSGLLWEAMRIAKEKKPEIMVAENVPNLINTHFKEDFKNWLNYLNKLGYNTYWKKLNSKNFKIPQDRKRVFIVSIREDIDDNKFKFPKKNKTNNSIYTFLEDRVNAKYNKFDYFNKKEKYNGFDYTNLSIIKLVNNRDRISHRNDGFFYTITAQGRNSGRNQYICNLKRVLTPQECFKLMGFNSKDYIKAKKILEEKFYGGRDRSDSRLYKMAGNSIVVTVLEELFKEIYKEELDEYKSIRIIRGQRYRQKNNSAYKGI